MVLIIHRYTDYSITGKIIDVNNNGTLTISVTSLYCHRKLGPPSKPRLCYNAILLKGVSDGETKTKNLHRRV